MELKHYGTPRHSGRYPWGSGENPQRNRDFLSYVNSMKKQGLSEVEIAKSLGMTTTELRNKRTLEREKDRAEKQARVLKLKDKGWSNVAIGKEMGLNESSVRALLDPVLSERASITNNIADLLKKNVDTKGFIDVGVGVENHLGISRTKLKAAMAKLEEEGYTVHNVQVPQLGTQHKTSILVLAPPGTKYSDIAKNKFDIKTINEYSEDGGRSFLGLEPINNVNSKRIKIRYAEEGGVDKDGIIELRRGVDDISLGNAKYAQVRIGVDGTHYLKGMAVYGDDFPDGIDIIFNTNKEKGTPMKGSKDNTVLKNMKDDPDNPFGSTVRQKHYKDKNGEEKLSALNIVYEEGEWQTWSKSLSSQFLSKQPVSLAKKQLELAYKIKEDEFNEIMALTNPIVKRRLLQAFADDCDSSAVHLKAAAMPRQASHVIIPITSIKENEIYAPNYRDGEKVVLVRYPHAGRFELPEVTVNNKNPEAKRLMGNAKDAIGIHKKVASQLSGADFDGDSVLVIPNPKGEIKTSSAIKALQDFDPQESYKGYPGMKRMSSKTKQIEMGKISNLITDMTIQMAPIEDIVRAVKHSMVVIDAEKHGLDYKRSFDDNGIASLKKKYQGSTKAGASTLISRASSEINVPDRKVLIDRNSGKKIYVEKDNTYINRNGKVVKKLISSTKMAEVDDAYKLSSGTVMESVYADHANKLKTLANKSRKEMVSIKPISMSPSAKRTYAEEVESLKSKLNLALKNKPNERQAQLLANYIVSAKKQANPNMDKDDLKKIKGQALAEARVRKGASKAVIKIEPKEWEAIQAGAISTNILNKIIDNADLDSLKQLATPRTKTTMTSSKIARAKLYYKAGYTQAEIAQQLGVPVSAISEIVSK